MNVPPPKKEKERINCHQTRSRNERPRPRPCNDDHGASGQGLTLPISEGIAQGLQGPEALGRIFVEGFGLERVGFRPGEVVGVFWRSRPGRVTEKEILLRPFVSFADWHPFVSGFLMDSTSPRGPNICSGQISYFVIGPRRQTHRPRYYLYATKIIAPSVSLANNNHRDLRFFRSIDQPSFFITNYAVHKQTSTTLHLATLTFSSS